MIMKENTINIIGRGISLKDFDFETLQGDVMAVNHLPTCANLKHVVYWDAKTYDKIKETTAYIHTIEPNAGKGDFIWKNRGDTVNLNGGEVGNINLSGWMAVNVALQLGYENIYLFGFDGNTKHGVNYDDNATDHRGDSFMKYNDKYEMFCGLAEIHNVINPEMPSAITCFNTITFEEYDAKMNKLVYVDIDDINEDE